MKIAQHNILYWRLLTALSIWWEKAKSLGLSVMVKPIYDSKWKGKKKYLLSKFSSFETSFFESDGDSERITSQDLVQKLTNQPTYSDEQITWC